jgi:hypothetical protein
MNNSDLAALLATRATTELYGQVRASSPVMPGNAWQGTCFKPIDMNPARYKSGS